MHTVVVYETTDETTFRLLKGDYTHLEGIIANTGMYEKKLEDEILELNVGESITTYVAKCYIESGANLVHFGVWY